MMTDETQEQTFASVWDALEDSPAEAANMRLRSDLMIALQEVVAGWGLTQAEAAQRLDVTQPRLNDLLRGRIGKFSLDALILLAGRAGLEVRMEVAHAAA
jgi:predicted XRE-type DNA-binding protein